MISFFSRFFKSAPNEPPAAKNPQTNPSVQPKKQSDATLKTYAPSLVNSALQGSTSKEKNAARQRIGELLDSGEITLEQISSDTSSQDDLLTLCSYSQDTASRILSHLTDQQTLAELANEAPTAQIRKAAAERVTERPALESMLKGAKGKDKNVYKIAKTGLAVYKAEDEILAKKHAHLESLCVDAERHAKKPFDHLYTHKFMALEEAWQKAQADTTPKLQARFDEAIANCQSIIDAEVARSKALALAEQQAHAALNNMNAAIDEVGKIAGALYTTDTIDNEITEQTTKALTQQAEDVSRLLANKDDDSKAFQQAHARYIKAAEACNGLLHTLQNTGSLASKLDAIQDADKTEGDALREQISSLLAFQHNLPSISSDAAGQAQTAIRDWQQVQKAKNDARKALLDAIGDLSRRANAAARNGQVRRARGIYRDLQEKRAQLDNIPAGLENKLEQLDETIAKLGDWHEFAVTPKKQELVETMKGLQESTLSADDLADKIHTLQDEWKVLCKGGENQDEALWKAFQEAADKAFEPCKKHFAEQAKMREQNAAERNKLSEQLEQYEAAYHWEQASWKDVEQTLRVAKDTWKALWPVPRQQQKDIQQRFDAALDKIYAHMNEAYDLVKQKKEQLITLAQKTAESTDLKAAAEDIKKLQASWKEAGRTYRKTDQQLWTQFRAICDDVFAKRQALYDEANAERDERIQTADTIIEKLHSLVKEGGSQLQTQGAAIAELKHNFSELTDLPKAHQHKYHAALKAIDSTIAQHRITLQREAWNTLFTLNTEISAYEVAPTESHKEQLEEALNTTKLPSGCSDILRARLNMAPAPNGSESAKALRLLCIRAEIANGKGSPDADKNLRMTYQVETLQQSFGSIGGDTNENLAKEWITHGACSAIELHALQDRLLESAFKTQAKVLATA